MSDETVRGVIDRFEEDYAVVVLDDGQQINWPRSILPADVRPGMAVVLDLALVAGPPEGEGDVVPFGETGSGWQGELTTEEGRWVVRLADGQELHWPITMTAMAQPGSRVNLQLQVDAEDTEARRKRVSDLLDDIFGTK